MVRYQLINPNSNLVAPLIHTTTVLTMAAELTTAEMHAAIAYGVLSSLVTLRWDQLGGSWDLVCMVISTIGDVSSYKYSYPNSNRSN